MKKPNKDLLVKYLVYFVIALLITVGVLAIEGFFTDSIAVNIQRFADGFSCAGFLLLAFAGMMYISGEGAFIGIGFVLRNVVQAFVPMGRKYHISYKEYREEKLGNIKKSGDNCSLIVGLVFFAIGIVLNIVWYECFYNVV